MADELKDQHSPDSIEMPAPTAWPFVVAFGITLLFAGLVTHFAVSGVGLIVLLRGAVGWWRDVLPHEKHEWAHVTAAERVQPVKVAVRTVEHLRVGTGGHRVRIPAEIHPYSAGIVGGIAGGIAMAAVASVFGLISHGSIWYPINLLAAGVVPSLAGADYEHLRQFSGVGLLAGVIMHGIFSPLVGLLYAVLLPMFPRKAGLWSGLITPLVWSALIASTLNIINPTLNERVDWTWFVASQVAFGLVCGYVVARSEKIETMQTWTFSARAGVEAPGQEEDEE
jgi:uncharacterized membrane protein YagU involved in acid resistance